MLIKELRDSQRPDTGYTTNQWISPICCSRKQFSQNQLVNPKFSSADVGNHFRGEILTFSRTANMAGDDLSILPSHDTIPTTIDTRPGSSSQPTETLGLIARQLAGLSSQLQTILHDQESGLDRSTKQSSTEDTRGSSVFSGDFDADDVRPVESLPIEQTLVETFMSQRNSLDNTFRDLNRQSSRKFVTTNGAGLGLESRHEASRRPKSSHGQSIQHDGSLGSVKPSIPDSNSQAIAVIGMSCRFPGDASNPERLWEMCARAHEAWSEWPKGRFNRGAFYHPNPERGGTFNAKGGHFLDQEMGAFDASFFNITPTEAKALDPQQRLQLENAYEALENAGITLDDVSGSSTGVFIGTSNHDYEHMLLKDPDSVPLYHAVGVSASIMANRISHFFNLRGPSVTVDTACSSSLVALHQACQSLRLGESRQAIVGGANLILEPGMLIPMSSLRFFSPDGTCYTYDHRASGYGRGEGVGTVILKPLNDAVRDGDTIRCVIRATGVNSDGRTAGLMLPSGEAQEALIRSTYAAAGLDPSVTQYVESHGTGTKAGDPIESGAIGRVFGAASAKIGAPKVRVGSVKSNIGHLENASGIAGLIKTILSLERGMILPNSNFEKPGDRVVLAENNLEVPTKLEAWPTEGLRRASVNSFGFGGTNAHCVIDDAENYLSSRGITGHISLATPRRIHSLPTTNNNEADSRLTFTPRMFVISANDKDTIEKLASSLATHFGSLEQEGTQQYALQLAYTLYSRRSMLPWREAVVASSLHDLSQRLSSVDLTPSRTSKPPKLGFVFTGQGAQWAGMGRELLDTYPVYKKTIEAADEHLRSIGCAWSLIEALVQDKESSQLGDASVSQPACTAVQLGVVDLLASWNVKPVAVVGHSSGEIAAAYAAGALTLESAMTVAYYRGQAMTSLKDVAPDLRGAMLAAGVSAVEAQKFISQLKCPGELSVACVNSPSSVTLSGDVAAIEEMAQLLDRQRLFSRRLQVDVAYHSQHMLYTSNEYLTNILDGTPLPDGAFPNHGIIFASSLEARVAKLGELGATYWVRNMVSPVQFSKALSEMMTAERDKSIDTLLEIGPHSILAGPTKQTLASLNLKTEVRYLPTLVRNQDANRSLLETACGLWKHGYPIDVNKANRLECPELKYGPLTDLPSYPFNHTINHWHESRLSRAYRHRKEGRHDILGALVPESNNIEPRWRNLLRVADVPWLKDHVVQSTVIYPAAGYIAMAIEAARQKHFMSSKSEARLKKFRLSNVSLTSALVVPNGDTGVETSLSLRPVPEGDRESSALWSEFRIFSFTDAQEWTEHCRGQISVELENISLENNQDDDISMEDGNYWGKRLRLEFHDCESQLSSQDLYTTFDNIGLLFGPTFCNLNNVFIGMRNNSISEILVPDTKATMPYETEFFNTIHPTVLDSCFQAAFPSLIHENKLKDPMVPTFIEQLTIDAYIPNQAGTKFKAYASTKPSILRNSVSDIVVFDAEDSSPSGPKILVSGLKTTSLTWGSNSANEADATRKLCYKMPWKVDLDLMTAEQVSSLWPVPDPSRKLDSAESLAVLEWLSFQYISDCLQLINSDDRDDMPQHHEQFYNWCLSQHPPLILSEPENTSLPAAHPILSLQDSEAKRKAAIAFAQTLGAEGEIVIRVGENLASILKGEIDPLALMVQDDLLTKVYTQDRSMLRCYELLRTYVTNLAFKQPGMKILEIGAGTGGATEPLLKTLGGGSTGSYPQFSDYVYTDISSAFFEKARIRFAAWDGMIEYRTLDIEHDTAGQGFKEGTFDLIIAANVLHATANMDVTMSNVRKLLKPGGRLIMVEITHPRLRISLPFGTLPGWWLGDGDGRKTGPLLTPNQWEAVLKRNGFDGLEVCQADYPGPYEMSSLVVSRATIEKKRTASTVHVFSPNGQDPAAFELNSLLKNDGRSLKLIGTDIDTVASGPLVILDIQSTSLLDNLDESSFSSIRNTLSKLDSILWVTSGANHQNPNAAMVAGLSRTLRNENAGLKLITLDLDPLTVADSSKAAGSILRVFKARFTIPDNSTDMELMEKGGQIQVPRLIEHPELNELLFREMAGIPEPPNLEPFYQPKRQLRLQVGTPGLLDSLHFVDIPDWDNSLDDDSVEFQVKAIGLNFRDVLTALGQIENPYPLGYDSSGVITAVGRNVKGFAIGDKVAALAVGSFTSVHRVDARNVFQLPPSLSFEDGASIPLAYATAYHALVDIARLSKGQRVLIHSAAGGVGQAAIKLAKLAEAEIFVTVGSNEKRQLMLDGYGIPASHVFSSRNAGFAEKIMRMTDGKGIEVVLNSLAGELLKESWRCIAMFGFFIEIGKRDIYANTQLEMQPFDKHVTFSAVDLSAVFAHRPGLGSQILTDCFKLFYEEKISVMKPITAFPIDQIEAAFRFMQVGKHSGKIVVTVPDDVQVMVAPKANTNFLKGDATYVIAGGVGGLGREICRWMVDHGARNIALLSRGGPEGNAKAQELVQACTSRGAVVKVYKCDTRDPAAVAQALRDIGEKDNMPPIRGIINGAMILRDSLFENMSFADWKAVTDTKLASSWNLHHQTIDLPLDFFILLSSASGVSGNRGQSNYAASSAFQDAFSRYRRSLGLPSTTLDLGMIESAGYVADNADSVAYLRTHGYSMIKLKEFFAMLRYAIQNSDPTAAANLDECQIITGYDIKAAEHVAAATSGARGGAQSSATSTIGLADAKFTHLPLIHLSSRRANQTQSSANQDGSSSASIPLRQALLAAEKGPSRSAVLVRTVTARLAGLLGRSSAADIDPEGRSVAALGVDSLVAVELRNWVVGEMGVGLPIFEILGARSLVELAGKIEAGCAFLREEDMAESEGENQNQGAAEGDVSKEKVDEDEWRSRWEGVML
ncbi:hypothetical protein F5X99DRAFT_137710 [Biscogniauxia marginata]|nr:hypothetical protein F5X99DRAFT_137710 [Biscogniauxia marginata]